MRWDGGFADVSPPPPGTPVPAVLAGVVGGRPVEPLWRNEIGGLTFRVDDGAGGLVAKWSPAGGPDLRNEAARMRWARAWAVVPEVLGSGAGPSSDTWLLTRALPGTMAAAVPWRSNPAVAVRAIGESLRRWHDTLPVAGCPWSWGVEVRSAGFGPDAVASLGDVPPVDRAVVCHGDTCAPNLLLDDSGRPCGFVDLGSLGVADRWADLAVATLSTTWNYGPGWEAPLLEAYGIAPDPVRTAFYRRLWEAT